MSEETPPPAADPDNSAGAAPVSRAEYAALFELVLKLGALIADQRAELDAIGQALLFLTASDATPWESIPDECRRVFFETYDRMKAEFLQSRLIEMENENPAVAAKLGEFIDSGRAPVWQLPKW